MLARLGLGLGLGLLVLGVGGRLAMVAFSLLRGLPVGLTVRGTAAVVVTGALYGLGGGALAWAAAPVWRDRPLARGVALGSVLFVIIGIVSARLKQISAVEVDQLLTFALFTPLALAYGLAFARVERRIERGSKA